MKKGIIEGFYGKARSFEERMSMVDFLWQIGMDQYIYAPKDDPYHNKKWREPYPKKDLEKIKELAEFSKNKNIVFTWAIHPGQNPFDFDNYEEEIQKIFDKYRQLRSIGVSSFGLCMDDIDRDKANEKRYDHMKLVKDLADFVEKESGSNLYFVHPWYNDDWIDEKGYEYESLLKDIENINVMWTGSQVVSPISHKSYEDFAKRTGKKPYIWFNWPVNDYKNDQIFIEVFEFFDSKDLNFDGFYLNPMNQAELSKIAIYQTNEFLKNPENYEAELTFRDAVKYLESKAYEDLIEIAPSFYGSLVYERTESKKNTEDMEIKKAYDLGDFENLRSLLAKKIGAIENYQKNHTNKALFDEIKNFLESLEHLTRAVLSLLDKKIDQAEECYKKSKSVEIEVFDGKYQEKNVRTSGVIDKIYKDLIIQVKSI